MFPALTVSRCAMRTELRAAQSLSAPPSVSRLCWFRNAVWRRADGLTLGELRPARGSLLIRDGLRSRLKLKTGPDHTATRRQTHAPADAILDPGAGAGTSSSPLTPPNDAHLQSDLLNITRHLERHHANNSRPPSPLFRLMTSSSGATIKLNL